MELSELRDFWAIVDRTAAVMPAGHSMTNTNYNIVEVDIISCTSSTDKEFCYQDLEAWTFIHVIIENLPQPRERMAIETDHKVHVHGLRIWEAENEAPYSKRCSSLCACNFVLLHFQFQGHFDLN